MSRAQREISLMKMYEGGGGGGRVVVCRERLGGNKDMAWPGLVVDRAWAW